MMRVVWRGKEHEWRTNVRRKYHFVFHGQLLLLVQSFVYFFARLPVGVRFGRTEMQRLLVACVEKGVAPNYLYPTIRLTLNYPHSICWWLVAGMTVMDYGYAHTRAQQGLVALLIDSPYTISGGGCLLNPTAKVRPNDNCNTPFSM